MFLPFQAMDELATDMEREMQLVNESKTPEARTSPPSVSETRFGGIQMESGKEAIHKPCGFQMGIF